MMIREYLKLARSFNAVLTGISPVMGAIAMGYYNLFSLFMLFLIGFFGHTYGFVLNDIIDNKIDKTSEEISDRPLLSGTISIKNAWIFAIISMIIAFVISFYIAYTTQIYYPIFILIISSILITIYNLTSKKLAGMDIFVTAAVFFLVLYGAGITVENINNVSNLAWIVCILGAIQVLYMQFIAGGMKDIDNDYKSGANTIAIKLGVRIIKGKLIVTTKFKLLAYVIQIIDLIVVFLPFFIVWKIQNLTILQYIQWITITFIGIIMLYISYKLLSMKKFERNRARRYIGSHYMINFTIVPIMLMSLNPWAGLLMFFPGLGFILSNIILHGTITQPKTM
jgi:4-hydroxybenzoate polyprenyltransferase